MENNFFTKEGFIYRAKHYYWPIAKWAITWVYNRIIAQHEMRKFKNTGYAEEVVDDASKIETAAKSENIPAPAVDVQPLDFVDAKVQLLDTLHGFLPHKQEFGKCVAFSVCHAHAFTTARLYGKAIMPNPDYIYMQRTTPGADGGMYPPVAFANAIVRGVSLHAPELNSIEALKKYHNIVPDEFYGLSKLNVPIKFIHAISKPSFEHIWSYINDTYQKMGPMPFQYSIHSYQGWWSGGDRPRATGNIYGKHSIIGITIPVVWNGVRGFFVLDSAYAKGRTWIVGKGIRFVGEDEFDTLTSSAILFDFIKVVEDKLSGAAEPEQNLPFNVELLRNCKRGDTGEHVRQLQLALQYLLKRKIPGAPSMYYGRNTANAVLEFQLAHADLFSTPTWQLYQLDGRFCGPQTIKAIKQLVK